MIRPIIKFSLILGFGLLAPTAAFAEMQVTPMGATAYLVSEHLDRGDDAAFAQFLESPAAAQVRIIYLDSIGGNTAAAIAIGRMIREHHLATAYHVGYGRCVSACTTMFLGGVERYYIGGDGVANGVATHLGLGFHPSNGGAANEDRIGAYYSEMGVPGAAEVRYKIYGRSVADQAETRDASGEPVRRKLFFVGGALAVKTGVATSLSEPADPALQDGQP